MKPVKKGIKKTARKKAANTKTTVKSLVVEYHYKDGDVGGYEQAMGAAGEVWQGFASDNKHTAFVVIRPNTDEAEKMCTPLSVVGGLQHACEKLIAAYKKGAGEGGSIEWEDVDLAHEIAVKALASVYGCSKDEVAIKVRDASTVKRQR